MQKFKFKKGHNDRKKDDKYMSVIHEQTKNIYNTVSKLEILAASFVEIGNMTLANRLYHMAEVLDTAQKEIDVAVG